MPIRKFNLTKSEYRDYQARLLRFQEMGTRSGAGDPPHESERLTLEQIDDEFAKVCELPLGEVAVVVLAKLRVLRSGILITDCAVTTPWGDFLDLSGPKECTYYDDLIQGLPSFPPTLLNPWLTHHVPLRPRQEEGVIIAHGRGPVPPECHDETLVMVKLLLTDEQDNKIPFEFEARVDRSVKRKYESRLQTGPEAGRLELRRALQARRLEFRRALRGEEPSSDTTPDLILSLPEDSRNRN